MRSTFHSCGILSMSNVKTYAAAVGLSANMNTSNTCVDPHRTLEIVALHVETEALESKDSKEIGHLLPTRVIPKDGVDLWLAFEHFHNPQVDPELSTSS